MKQSLRLALALTLAAPALASGQAIGPGFELERSGRYADAANAYLMTLRSDPVNISALLGLERVLFVLNRLPELLPLVQRARGRLPENTALRGLELRVYAGLNQGDSLTAVALRWAATVPQSETPYREWALALADRRAYDDARKALLLGRKTLGGEGTLAIELAELEQRAGNWEASAREWGRAVVRSPDAAPNAASQIAETPATFRDRVVRVLSTPDVPPRVRRVAAEAMLSWGQATEAWALFEPTLAGRPDSEAQGALRRFIDLAASVQTPEGHRVRGLALSRWGDVVPSPAAERARAEAVRELLEGGDRVAARRVLEAHSDASAVAQGSLLQILIADGQLDLVERRLAEDTAALSGEDRGTLRLALARARVARGELDRAAAALGDDSSVAAIAQQGWIALYRGDLKNAMAAFRMAGPYAGDRAGATDRTAMMALLQRIQQESSPDLGAALLTLARGDSAGSVAALRRAAARLPPQGGRLEVLLIAGQVAARLGGSGGGGGGGAGGAGSQAVTATALFDEIVRAGGEGGGAAPAAAELEWARLLMRQGRSADAIPHLEHLILTYPNSAFVPEARRELERARGAIPKS
jgi:tetratricopeptide (TPR) repeat protein